MIRVLKSRFVTGVLQLIALTMGVAVAPHIYAQSFEQVAAGAAHICALDTNGEVDCTTTTIATRFLPPDDLPPLREISAGQQHTCGITLDDTVECWGTDAFGVLQVPVFDAPVQSISVGFNHTCAIDIENQVRCWGLNTNAQLDVPDVPGGFVAVDAGRVASCGIDISGDVHCWSTDSFFPTDDPVPGPFVQLDIDSNQACGITANGDIECFAARERNRLAPPVNGPYTDLTVTNSAICGLRTDQLLDCSFAEPVLFELDTLSGEYPLDEPFLSIERTTFQFGAVGICAISANDGAVSCFGGGGDFLGNLPPPPGSSPVVAPLTAADISLALTAEVYEPNQVELFWNRLPNVFPPVFVEVFRDDELLTTTENGFSFFDDEFDITGEEMSYRIRAVDDAGNVGEFSNSILVNSLTRSVELLDDGVAVVDPRSEDLLLVQDLVITAFNGLVSGNDSFILSWSIDNSVGAEVNGFEIRIDNEPVGFVGGTTFVGDGVEFFGCRTFSVVAIDDDGVILDFATVAFGNGTFACRSTR